MIIANNVPAIYSVEIKDEMLTIELFGCNPIILLTALGIAKISSPTNNIVYFIPH